MENEGGAGTVMPNENGIFEDIIRLARLPREIWVGRGDGLSREVLGLGEVTKNKIFGHRRSPGSLSP